MSSLLNLLLLLSLTQCYAYFDTIHRRSARLRSTDAIIKTLTFAALPIETPGPIEVTPTGEITKLYEVFNPTLPDHAVMYQEATCPGRRPVWGSYVLFECEYLVNEGFYYRTSGLQNDPAPPGSITVVDNLYSDLDSCTTLAKPLRQLHEVLETAACFDAQFSRDLVVPAISVYTKTPFPASEVTTQALLSGFPHVILKEIKEDSQVFARHSNYSSMNPPCTTPLGTYWFTTDLCLPAQTPTTITYDNHLVISEHYYSDAQCTVLQRLQGEAGQSVEIDQCIPYEFPLLPFVHTIFPKPIIFEGYSESSESSEGSEIYNGNFFGNENGGEDKQITSAIVVTLSVCIVLIAATAASVYMKWRYCGVKEQQENNLNLEDTVVVIA